MFLDIGQGKLRTGIEWVLYVFIALFPFVLYRGYLFNGSSTRAINLVLVVEILAIVLGFVIIQGKRRLALAKSPITIALFIFLATLFISGISGIDFSASFWSKATRTTGIFYFLHIGLFYLFLVMFFKEEKKIRNFILVFLVSAGIFSIASLLGREGFGIIYATRPWSGFTIGNSTFAAMYLFAAFMLSIYYVWSQSREDRPWWKYLIPIVFLLNPFFINQDLWLGNVNIFKNPLGVIGSAQTSTYTVIISVAFLFIIWLVSKIKQSAVRRKITWTLLVLGFVGGTIVLGSFLSPGGYLQRAYLTQASGARPIVWELSRNAIKDRPVLGWGTDNFDRAFERYYDNRLLEQKNGAEAWFDRAHNIFIDQMLDTGYIGIVIYSLAYLVIIGSMVFVLFRSRERKDHVLSVIVIVYFIGHLIELQTAFDTTTSYVPLAFIAALAAALFHKVYSANTAKTSEWVLPKPLQYVTGAVLIGLFGYFFFAGTFPIMRAQAVNGTIRTIGSSEKRLPLYETLFSSPLDKGTFLWRTITDIQRGVAINPSIIQDPKKREGFTKELAVFVNEYKEYLENNSNDYRAHLNLADAYIYERLFDVDHLNDAHAVLDNAIKLVPEAPQAYWMKSVAYLYQRKFDLAREWAKKGYDLNPSIEESKRVVEYINQSIRTFPEIDLFDFKHI